MKRREAWNESAYDRQRRQAEGWAQQWEKTAEVARMLGNLELAHACADLATKCRFLAERDPDVEDAFNSTATMYGVVE